MCLVVRIQVLCKVMLSLDDEEDDDEEEEEEEEEEE